MTLARQVNKDVLWSGETSTTVESLLVEHFQHNLPLVIRPYEAMGDLVGCSGETVIEALRDLTSSGRISRVGPVFRPNTIGASTLAAMAVPASRLDTVAELVNVHREINHNYQRDHHFNLWFVVTARTRADVERVLQAIRAESGLEVLDLPLEAQYHIDLGFSLQTPARASPDPNRCAATVCPPANGFDLSASESRLVASIQSGLPLTSRPFRQIAASTRLSEAAVITTLRRWLAQGVVARVGLVARHHELGYRANAMVVWNVPDQEVDAVGKCLGQFQCVTLCYRRPRRSGWPYNLFCMVHGRDRKTVLDQIDQLVETCHVGHVPHEILFSVRRFKQTGARYR